MDAKKANSEVPAPAEPAEPMQVRKEGKESKQVGSMHACLAGLFFNGGRSDLGVCFSGFYLFLCCAIYEVSGTAQDAEAWKPRITYCSLIREWLSFNGSQ